jgi:16S rRNA (cytosine967-C5)-methyltransferase
MNDKRLRNSPPAQPPAAAPAHDKPGLAARDAAMRLFQRVLSTTRALDDETLALADDSRLGSEDRALARAIATTSFRHLGTIKAVIDVRAESGLPDAAGMLEPVLITAVAQILFMEVADHAAVDLAVSLIHADPHARRYAKFANGLLRAIGREARDIREEHAHLPRIDLPEWLTERWSRSYGSAAADAISLSFRAQPSIDITLNEAAARFDAARLPHVLLPTGSLRLTVPDRIETLPGFAEGAWWVQDAAAALPARLLRPRTGERILDLCAAPGGKTAQLAAAGAEVIAVDRSAARLKRLSQNMDRLGLTPEILEADGTSLALAPFDAILLDAPCSATGTIRRHPELAWTRTLEDLAKLIPLQGKLLDAAARLLKPGGRLVYAVCSLEPEEGERQIEAFLARHPQFKRAAISADEIGGLAASITPVGEMRVLPQHLELPSASKAGHKSGTDGFFAARLTLTGM